MMSAPSATRRCACAKALSGARNFPPSENESGVTFSTPITAAVGRDSSPRSTGWSDGAVVAACLEGALTMGSLCAVPAWESRSATTVSPGLVADLRLQLAGLGNQLLDRLFGRQNADQLPFDVHLFHVLGEPCRIAQRQLPHSGDAGRADQ